MERRSELKWISLVALVVLSVYAAIEPVQGADHSAADVVYANPIYRWSIKYPAGWMLYDNDPAFVRMHSPEDKALCGVHSGPVRFLTLDAFTDFMLAKEKNYLNAKGLLLLVPSRQRVSLANGVAGNDVLAEVVSAWKSRRLYVMAHGLGFAINCETYVQNREELDPLFDRILRSFRMRQ